MTNETNASSVTSSKASTSATLLHAAENKDTSDRPHRGERAHVGRDGELLQELQVQSGECR
eukprot:CAMPEP_0194347126 /NCGR_PEP_ID=MMETSP0171-20130528/105814_1 /TAXON_ID=218684 /ORGANISM="Corethron pennatum, Strain L29A3" /LENGTH=60 /DNA_ID=CAMNT_0039114339 /DNA_START=908 /DNA_END=1090 /DNA_ORIENTATION=-